MKLKDLSFSEKLKTGYNPMMEGVRWTEKYALSIEKQWKKVPARLGQALIFASILLLASGLQGDWIVILVHFYKFLKTEDVNVVNGTLEESDDSPADDNGSLLFYISASVLGSYAIYFSIGGFLHWYFYVRQRDKSHEWKIQPDKFLTPELERHEILTGSLSLFVVSSIAGYIAWYCANGGKYVKVYYRADEFGWLWFFLQVPSIFIYQDYMAYLIHRVYHTRFLYKHIHKLHHKYKQPTAFSVTALHPVELVTFQLVMASPMLVVPVNWILFYATMIYVWCQGIIDHSGIDFKAQWWQPWQPDAVFHDNHHQYSHLNYGFNMSIWDRLHGTYRKKDRIYREDIFSGKGKALHEATPEELARDIIERKSENLNAHQKDSERR